MPDSLAVIQLLLYYIVGDTVETDSITSQQNSSDFLQQCAVDSWFSCMLGICPSLIETRKSGTLRKVRWFIWTNGNRLFHMFVITTLLWNRWIVGSPISRYITCLYNYLHGFYDSEAAVSRITLDVSPWQSPILAKVAWLVASHPKKMFIRLGRWRQRAQERSLEHNTSAASISRS